MIQNPKYGFFKLKGSNNEFNARLIEFGTSTADIVKDFNGNSINNKFNLELVDFQNSPTIRFETGARNSEFIIRRSFKSKKNALSNLKTDMINNNPLGNGNKIIYKN